MNKRLTYSPTISCGTLIQPTNSHDASATDSGSAAEYGLAPPWPPASNRDAGGEGHRQPFPPLVLRQSSRTRQDGRPVCASRLASGEISRTKFDQQLQNSASTRVMIRVHFRSCLTTPPQLLGSCSFLLRYPCLPVLGKRDVGLGESRWCSGVRFKSRSEDVIC